MLRRKLFSCSLLVVLVSLSPSLWSASPSFLTSSTPRTVRIEGLAELAGAVSFTVTNPGATAAGGSYLSVQYSAPISATASDNGGNGAVVCVIGGVPGACPSTVSVQPSGNSVYIEFTGAGLTFPNSGDGISIVQVRLNVTGLSQGSQVTAALSGSAGSLTQSQLVVVSSVLPSLSVSGSTFTPSTSGAAACSSPGTSAMGFSVSVAENIPGAFSTKAQESATLATNGANLEVLLTNVPAGVTITPVSTTGSSAALTFAALPAAITQTTTGNMIFSFAFTAVNDGGTPSTAVVNFAAGFTNPIALTALAATPITARARLGPVSNATVSPPVIVSFVDNTAVSGTPFAIVPCALYVTGANPVKFQTIAGSGPIVVTGVQLYEGQANTTAYTAMVSTTTGGNWLSASPLMGVTPASFNVTFDATNLTAGTYNGQIVVTAVGSASVTLNAQFVVVSASPTIALNQSSFSFSGLLGATNPPVQTTIISNSGSGAFNWTTSASTVSGGNWLSVSPASGTGSGGITASVNIAGLAAGTYNGTIVVASTGATNTPQTISVVLTVTAPPSIAPSPATLSFNAGLNSNPPSQTLTINNSGGGTLGVTVTTSTASGGNWLVATPSTGTAPLSLTVSAAASTLAAGNYQGTITITGTAPSGAQNSPQNVAVTLTVGAPVISKGGVVNAASYAANASVAPGSIGSIFGGLFAATPANAGTPLPTNLGGVQVLLNGNATPAVPLFYVSPTQINFQMPVEATASTATLTVVSAGLASLPITVNTAAVYPGIFTVNGAGSGLAAALNTDYSPNSTTNPAPAGAGILLYVTGLGATNPAVATGQAGATVPPLNQTVITPTVMIGGVSANVGFSGLAPGFVGLYQLNVTIPQGTASGLANVQVIAGGATSNTVQIAVK
jgi:uncharacterized protein (TIGR03437 family)